MNVPVPLWVAMTAAWVIGTVASLALGLWSIRSLSGPLSRLLLSYRRRVTLRAALHLSAHVAEILETGRMIRAEIPQCYGAWTRVEPTFLREVAETYTRARERAARWGLVREFDAACPTSPQLSTTTTTARGEA